MTEPTDIAARFIEDPPSGKLEEERAHEGWMVIKDRATGRAMILNGNSREMALWILRALNAADQHAEWFDTREAPAA